jgi:hypothetical protein
MVYPTITVEPPLFTLAAVEVLVVLVIMVAILVVKALTVQVGETRQIEAAEEMQPPVAQVS